MERLSSSCLMADGQTPGGAQLEQQWVPKLGLFSAQYFHPI